MPKKRKTRPRKKQKTLHALKVRAWKLLSECVRREAADANGMVRCYTCDEVSHWKEIQCGHAIPGRTGATLLDEEILRPQNAKCNIWGRGQYHIFAAKLIREKAEELTKRGDSLAPFSTAMDWWQFKLQDSRQVRKWDRQALEEKIEGYKARLDSLGRVP